MSNQAQLFLKPACQFRQQILPLSSSSWTFRQICSSILTAVLRQIKVNCNSNLFFDFDSMADFASKLIKLNFPWNLLGNFDSSFVSNEGQLSRKSARQFRQQILPASSSSSTFPQICSSISTADFASELINLNFPQICSAILTAILCQIKLNFSSNLLVNFDSRFCL